MERRYLIPTQQITAELAERIKRRVDNVVLNARFKWMLELFMKNRKMLPEEIVITRDGVSEGQYRMVGYESITVIEDELDAIKEACEEFGNLHNQESWKPRFTLVITTKRHHARFFKEDQKGIFFSSSSLIWTYLLVNFFTLGIANPLPGTVIDTDVVRNDLTEFYMLNHRPIQGTAKAPSYQVIVDEIDMGNDEVQALMSALAFHHQIVNAPVSIPEPIYQADEWAKRGKDIWKAYT
ncbi:unnamed protein product [Strongylus vulgaris]|uniref:Piwi domain-containing protein n=1 Tax=Strongylus vulgaris TaxID=40348 RepID=A0A3P7JL22_STRVU|nr:unnamed protein product [Strongylus vulgaris]